MKWWTKNKSVVRWLRVLHRDIGFLMVGVSIVYALSGILLNHMKGEDPAFRTKEKMVELTRNMGKEELEEVWKLNPELPVMKKILPMDEDRFRVTFQGGMGVYDPATGYAKYEVSTRRVFIYWINKLHYNQVKGWHIVGDLFAVSLIFLAVSGLLIVNGKRGIMGTGKWYLIVGLLIPVLYILFV